MKRDEILCILKGIVMAVGFCWALWPFWTAPTPEWSIYMAVVHIGSVFPWLLAHPVRLVAAAPVLLWFLSIVLRPPVMAGRAGGI